MEQITTRSLIVLFFPLLLLLAGCSLLGISGDDPVQVQPEPEPVEIGLIEDLIGEDAEVDEGLFTVYDDDDTWYYEIPDTLLGRDMLTVSRIAKTADGIGYGGEQLSRQILRWDRRDDQVLLRRVSFNNVASDTLPIFEAVQISNFEPIIMAFDIEAFNEDSSSVLIDVTSLLTSDVPAFGLQQGRRSEFQVRRVDPSRTFIEHIRSFPENVEARHLITYDAGNPPSNSSTNTISLELNHSMVLLPKEPMQPRHHDPRVEYISVTQQDYGMDVQRAEQLRFAVRWKLVPKDPEAYLRGELVEPVEPIVFYIDPATPMKWREWLKKGVEDWQPAFEEAGFRNAIIAKDPPSPEEDPEFSPEDARYPMIRYYASPIQNAYGPQINDPRSGEIISTSIGWYHNVMNLLRNWYFIQTSAANPEARGTQFDDDVMGELIRFVSAHEVGHTLGLPHNWGSSYAFPVDSLRSPTFTDEYGTTPSIMDYARFNYIAQPGDGVTNFLPRVGEYDLWSVKWGYTWFGDTPIEEQRRILNEWVKERADDPRYFYGHQSSDRIDPRAQNEDLGNDAVRAGEYGLANLQVIVENLMDWIGQEGEDFSMLDELYNQVITQWGRYMGHAMANIGGVYEDHKTFDQEGVVYTAVPPAEQQRALEFLGRHAFSSPSWIINHEILDRTQQIGLIDGYRARQVSFLNQLTDLQRLGRLIEYEHRSSGGFSAIEMMDQLRSILWSELMSGSSIDVYRRNLQRAWVDRMGEILNSEGAGVNQSDIRAIARDQLQLLQDELDSASTGGRDRATRIHLEEMADRAEKILNP
ncbi:MAG: zinc-dependent metalloprotease [Balneolaceae bacterium]